MGYKDNRTIRLTQKRLRALDNELHFDDLLYAKFRLLNADLHRKAEQLMHNKKRLWRVERRHPKYNEILQVVEVHETPVGMLVIVR